MSGFSIGERRIGEGAPVVLIAELSANHGQRKDVALRTIEAAAKAGADAIKLQTYTPDTLTLDSTAPPFVVKTKNEWAGRTLHDLYKEAMTPWEWHAELKAATEALGMIWFSTPFDHTAVAFLEGLGAGLHKIASFELNDLPLVERVARSGVPMILSTGMATLGDIEAAIAVCREAGNERLVLLRCVSAYPARPESMDLRSFDTLRSFGTVVGLSDHTRDATVAIASVALGAKVIEKHFILERSVGGPDAFFSLEPAEFAAMVKAVRDTEAALGRPRFGPSAEEVPSTAFRRSLFVSASVEAGAVLTCDNVRSVRPSLGLAPRFLPQVLGRRAARALTAGTPLTWDAVGGEAEQAVRLRRATSDDSSRLLAWRNDPVTRQQSISTNEVSGAEHAAWVQKSIASTSRILMIAEVDGDPVGTIRADQGEHGAWEVSLTVAPEARRKGYASMMLRALESTLRSEGAVRLTARIRVGNEPSLRAFKQAGYYAITETAEMLSCERRIAAYR